MVMGWRWRPSPMSCRAPLMRSETLPWLTLSCRTRWWVCAPRGGWPWVERGRRRGSGGRAGSGGAVVVVFRIHLGEATSTQCAVDRCRRHDDVVVMLGLVPSDRVRSGVKALGDQFATQRRDQLGGLAQGGPGRVGPPGAGLELRLALAAVAGEQPRTPTNEPRCWWPRPRRRGNPRRHQ
jgi:hypothetical protein